MREYTQNNHLLNICHKCMVKGEELHSKTIFPATELLANYQGCKCISDEKHIRHGEESSNWSYEMMFYWENDSLISID